VLNDLHQEADLGRLTRIPRLTEHMWEPTGRHDKNAAGSERSPQESAGDGEDGARTHAEGADGEHLVVLVVVALAHRRLGPSSSATT
jgi:hypothetical protein